MEPLVPQGPNLFGILKAGKVLFEGKNSDLLMLSGKHQNEPFLIFLISVLRHQNFEGSEF